MNFPVLSPAVLAAARQRLTNLERAAAGNFSSIVAAVSKGKSLVVAESFEPTRPVSLFARESSRGDSGYSLVPKTAAEKKLNKFSAEVVVSTLGSVYGSPAAQAVRKELEAVFAGKKHLDSRLLSTALAKAKSVSAPRIYPKPPLPFGLTAVKEAMDSPGGLLVSGKKYHLGQRLGERLFVVGQKTKGVEPGVIALEPMGDAQRAMLEDPEHPLLLRTAEYLVRELEQGDSAVSQATQKWVSANVSKEIQSAATFIESFVAHLTSYQETKDLNHLTTQDRQLLEALKADKDHFVSQFIEDYLMIKEPAFFRHYIKLDYKEEDMRRGIMGERLVQIPYNPSKGKVRGAIHRAATAKTPREANWGAIRETLANDIMATLKIWTQKLRILPSQYEHGETKLLLDGMHMTGPKGEMFRDFSGSIKDGYLVDAEGKMDDSIEGLGKYLIYFLLLADRDAIGTRGDNKGRTGNTFAAIDPGHALEVGGGLFTPDLMAFRNIHDDFSFDQPKGARGAITGGYKNFTIFQDRPYLEKFEGILQIRNLAASGEDIAAIDAYLEVFGEGAKRAGDLDFAAELQALRQSYIDRRAYILEVFAPRLSVYDTDPVGGPAALTLVDALEKLTSKTSSTSPKGEVELKFPRVLDKGRISWDVSFDAKSQTYLFEAPAGTPGRLRQVQGFLQSEDGGLPDGVEIKSEGGKIIMSVSTQAVSALAKSHDLGAVAQFKASKK